MCVSTGADLDQGAWLHLACAVWTPEVYFERAAELQGLRLNNLTAERVELRCGICKQVQQPAARPCASIVGLSCMLMERLHLAIMLSKWGPAVL